MRRFQVLRKWALSCILAGSWQTSFAAEPAPKTPVDRPVELLLLAQDKITRVEVRVKVDGTSLSAIWDESFARIFAFCDRNGDGVLDAKEATLLPAPLALRHGMGNGFIPPVGKAPTLAELDRNSDGKVNLEELTQFYRSAGLGNFLIGVGTLPAGTELTDALLQQLDTNRDGKITEDEWKAAAETLKKADKNDDELIGAGELVAKVLYPGAAGTTLLTPPSETHSSEVLKRFPVLLLSSDPQDTFWTTEFIRRRDRDGDGKLSAAETGFDAARFAQLDTDKDGKLSAVELQAWRKQDADARWVVELGTKGSSDQKFAYTGGQLRWEGWAAQGKIKEALATARRSLSGAAEKLPAEGGEAATNPRRVQSTEWLTAIADRDGDGKVDSKEREAWFALQEQVARGQVLLTLLDSGAGGSSLLELLDLNHDGALSVRELRGAWERIRSVGAAPDGHFDRSKLPRILLAAVSQGYPETLGIDLRTGPAWFRAMDKNGDGDVSRREFTGPPALFTKLDLDNDGLLTALEAEKATDTATKK